MKLPDALEEHLNTLFESLPIDQAMPDLFVQRPQPKSITSIVEDLIDDQRVGPHSPLAAGLWLYVDELDRSHSISQSLPDSTGSFWHGIMHRREGDFGNSHYWFHRCGQHAVISDIPNYEPHGFIDLVESNNQAPLNELVAIQRAEWMALFAWCSYNRDY